MTDTYKVLSQSEVGTASAALYTVPASTEAIIKHIDVVCTLGDTLQLWVGGAADANVILPKVTFATDEFAQWDGTLVLEAAQTINGDATTAGRMTVTIYGDEVS